MVTLENDHQRSTKSPLNEIDVQMDLIHLFLIILIVFMICTMKDAQWHLAQNLSFCYPVTENNLWPKNQTRNETTDIAFAVKHNPQGIKKLH